MDWSALVRNPLWRRSAIVIEQAALAGIAYLAAFGLRFDLEIGLDRYQSTVWYLIALRFLVGRSFRLDSGYWRHVGVRDLIRMVTALTVGSILFPLVLYLAGELRGIPPAVFVLDWLLAIAFMGGARVVVRWLHETRGAPAPRRGKRTFIVGAGEAGEQLLRQIQHDAHRRNEVVGLIDDDPEKRERALHGVPILGGADELRGLVRLHRVSLVLIAVPSATPAELRRLVERAMESGAEVRLLPPIKDMVTADINLGRVRDVRLEDLLGREPVRLELEAIGPEIAGKVVAITGAGGSIGSELARQIVRFHPLELILIDRAESSLYFSQLEVSRISPETRVVPVLASVTNRDRMRAAFTAHRPHCVFHAAAYKHVPMLEANVVEALWNNVIGTLRVAECAALVGSAKFVLISTDKAASPTSVLGATKRIAERIMLELPSLRASSTDFRVVRFGNVLGSDGSVVPLFQRQLAVGGPLTVTHPEARRYLMTIPEAVQLVLQATTMPEAAGRIALLEMGTEVRIVDLAEQLIRLAGLVPHQDVKIVFVGLRPGEKLREELVGPTETAVPTDVPGIRLIERAGTDGDELGKRLRSLPRLAGRMSEAGLLRAVQNLSLDSEKPRIAAERRPNLKSRVKSSDDSRPRWSGVGSSR